jgi:hypothetical protein
MPSAARRHIANMVRSEEIAASWHDRRVGPAGGVRPTIIMRVAVVGHLPSPLSTRGNRPAVCGRDHTEVRTPRRRMVGDLRAMDSQVADRTNLVGAAWPAIIGPEHNMVTIMLAATATCQASARNAATPWRITVSAVRHTACHMVHAPAVQVMNAAARTPSPHIVDHQRDLVTQVGNAARTAQRPTAEARMALSNTTRKIATRNRKNTAAASDHTASIRGVSVANIVAAIVPNSLAVIKGR